MVAAVTSYCSPKKLNQILGLKTIAVTLKVLSFLKSIHRRGFLPAENRLKSAFRANKEVWSVCWRLNLKNKKSILKYFIAEESSNIIILDGNISWCT